jgi:hypothetical protein
MAEGWKNASRKRWAEKIFSAQTLLSFMMVAAVADKSS